MKNIIEGEGDKIMKNETQWGRTPRLASDIAPLTLSFNGKAIFGYAPDGSEVRIAEMTGSLTAARVRGTTIVNAVNSYANLVSALKHARDRLKFDLDLDHDIYTPGASAPTRPNLLAELEEALEKAGEK